MKLWTRGRLKIPQVSKVLEHGAFLVSILGIEILGVG